MCLLDFCHRGISSSYYRMPEVSCMHGILSDLEDEAMALEFVQPFIHLHITFAVRFSSCIVSRAGTRVMHGKDEENNSLNLPYSHTDCVPLLENVFDCLNDVYGINLLNDTRLAV